MNHQYNPGLYRLAFSTLLATLVLIIAGGLVTSNDAGLSVPDWPLSFGRLMPEMVGGVFYEHGHRMIAAGVGLLTLVLALWLWKAEPRRWVRRLGLLALLTVIVQGVLGGITVLLMLPTPVSVLHACLAQAFFCLLLILTVVTSREWLEHPGSATAVWRRSEFRIAAMTTLAIYLQLIFGALLRHSGTVAGSKGVEILTSILIVHIAGALAVAVAVLVTAMVVSKESMDRQVSRLSYSMVGLLMLQLMLGVGAYVVRLGVADRPEPLLWHVWVTTAHVAGGALLLATSLLLTLKLFQIPLSTGEDSFPESRLVGEHR